MSRPMKDSGVEWIGDIPEGWSVGKLKHFAKVKSGTYIDKNDYVIDGKYDIVGSNGKIGRTNKFNNAEKVITTGRVGTIGTAYIIEEGWITDNALVISANAHIQLKYAYYVIPNFDFSNLSTGTAQPLITGTSIKNVKIPCPASIEEQQKIAAFLDNKASQIDSIIDNTKQSIVEFKKYKQALITETVTKGRNLDVKMKGSGIEWIGEIPEHWDVWKLKQLFEIKKVIAGKLGYDILSITQNGLKIKDISSNEGQISADYSKYQIVDIGDFAMNHMDLLTGWIDCATFLGVTSPDYRVFKSRNSQLSNNNYYKYTFQVCYSNKIFYGLGQGVSNLGRWRLPTSNFLNFFIPHPPIDEQQQIADFLDEKTAHIDSLIADKEKMVQELQEYKKSLIYEYVTGKKEV